jgi:hypothetical protein
MPATAGDTFLLTRGTGEVPHLWVILWGPVGAAQAFLAVYLTTLRSHSDRSCILTGGEHPFVQHDTAVAYGAVQRWTDEKLGELVARGIARAPARQRGRAGPAARGILRLAAYPARTPEHGRRGIRRRRCTPALRMTRSV